MAGHQVARGREVEAGLLLQDPDHRQADGHQGRLGVLGQPQVVLRAFEHEPAEVLGQRIVDLLKEVPGHRKGLRQPLSHPDGLAALAGKNESARHGKRPEISIEAA